MPPQTNAQLTLVQAATSGEAFDGPPAPGPDKWAGQAGAYLRERRRRVRTAEGEDIVLDRLLLVDRDLNVDFRVGDIVTFARTGQAEEAAEVAIVQRPEVDDPEIPQDLQTVRLTLAGS